MVGGPLRFDVQVARAGVSLRLAAPVAVGPARVTELVLDLGRVPPPIDLSSGAVALRHRRSRVTSLRVEVPHVAWIAHAEARGVSVGATPDPRGSRVRLGGRDAPEPVWVFPIAVGLDLLLIPFLESGDGTPRLGDAEALGALLQRAGGWGEALPGAARIEALPQRVLTEACATRGHRVPSLGPLPAAAWVTERALHLAAGDALRAHAGPPDLADRITDMASLIERSAGGGTGALLRDAAARLEGAETGPSTEQGRRSEHHRS